MRDSISFIIPVYNTEESLLRSCIDSVLNQMGNEDEVIIVDDGSQPQTGRILDAYAHPNMYVYHQTNAGVSVARNMGISRATGEWLVFVDSDDYIVDGGVEAIRSGLGLDYDVIIYDYLCKDDNGNLREYTFFNMDKPLTHQRINLSLLRAPKTVWDGDPYLDVGTPWAKAYRREYIISNSFCFDERCLRHQDNVFNMYVLNGTDRIHYCNKTVYFYTIRHKSSNDADDANKRFVSVPLLGKLHYKYYEDSEDEMIIKYRDFDLMNGLEYEVKEYFLNPGIKTKEDKKEWLQKIYNDDIYRNLLKHSFSGKTHKILLFAYKYHLLGLLKPVFKLRDGKKLVKSFVYNSR